MINKFKPAWWLPGPHLQTLVPALFRRRPKLNFRPERMELADGDFLDLCWVGSGNGPIVLVLHGLNGSINSRYINGILRAISKRGWRGVLMHFRNCSGEPNRLPRSYHSGETQDLSAVLSELHRRQPNSPIFVIGYSLGGNVLLKALGEDTTHMPIKAAVAISIPFELAKTADHMSKGFARIYQWRLVRELKKAHRAKFKKIKEPIEFGNIGKLRTFWEFDNRITAPLHGFKSADDYYEQSSSRQYLAKIKVPTLIVHARNDPFTNPNSLPEPREVSKHVHLEITEGGGHVGFVAGKFPWRPVYWLENKVLNYLENEL